MEATVVSVAKSVLDGALSSAKSAVAEEITLQLGVQRDLAFIKDEFEMMQTFLIVADEERSQKKVVKTWVKQVRDLAYDVEDCLQDYAVRLQKKTPWWRFPRTLQARHRIAIEIKELRARVDDVSQRNLRYCLISDGRPSNPAITSAGEPYGTCSMAAFGAQSDTVGPEGSKVDLMKFISSGEKALRVISVWGKSDLGRLSIIRKAYDDTETKKNFGCRAWVKVMHPFNPVKFIRSLVWQLFANSTQQLGIMQEATVIGIEIMNKIDKMAHECLTKEFARHVNEKKYLIVLDDLYAMEEWDWIKTWLPDKENGSRIVVSTQHHEIAQLCVEQPVGKAELRNLSYDHPPAYVSFNKGVEHSGSDPIRMKPELTNEIEEGQPTSEAGRNLVHSSSMINALEEARLTGREQDKSTIVNKISQGDQKRLDIAVYGIDGVGKTALVRSVYQSQTRSGMFKTGAWVSISHPFNVQDFRRRLYQELDEDLSLQGDGKRKQLEKTGSNKLTVSHEHGSKKSPTVGFHMSLDQRKQLEKTGSNKLTVSHEHGSKKSPTVGFHMSLDQRKQLEKTGSNKLTVSHEHGSKKSLIVVDDLSSRTEWDLIKQCLPKDANGTRVIITTKEATVANLFEHRCKVDPLGDEDALELFKKKVFKETEDSKWNDDLEKEAKVILKKCGGHPLAIATIGGFLATRPKDVREWRNLSNHVSAELTSNPRFGKLQDILTSTYEGLPYDLKSCFLYLSIFPEDNVIRRRRLVRRWIAEGYAREKRGMTVEEVAEQQFTDLIHRSMIQPSESETSTSGKIDFCKVQNLMHEISISKSQEENLVLVLDKDEHCTLQPKDKVRHLVVSRSWSREQKKDVFGSVVDVSRIRSLTVFGEWRSFFISKKMRLLRVLDLEDVKDLRDHDLVPIGDLRHLKYLSLRGCLYIYHLPDSFGNLSDLETLDIRRTFVITLPASIVKLSKLKYLRAGLVPIDEDHSWEENKIDQPLKEFGLAAYESYLRRKSIHDLDALPYLCYKVGVWYGGWDEHGVKVPRGIGRLTALHTLGIVNIARGKAMLKELKKLTQLRKLGVTGINKKKWKELCSAIANHGCLRSLSMRAEGKPGLEGCLDDLSPPRNDLESLKLYGRLVKLPKWIEQMQMLAKLILRSTLLEHDAIKVLGDLPNLSILRLGYKSWKVGELRFHFLPDTFTSLTVLQLDSLDDLKSVEFEEKATPKLELLRVQYCFMEGGDGFSGIRFLPSLKEVSLSRWVPENIREGLRDQLAENKNKPHLKIED